MNSERAVSWIDQLSDGDGFKSVLFVCWGNVCRSPAAALMLKRELRRKGVPAFQIDSAGVGADIDQHRPSLRMRWATLQRGLWLKPKPRLFRKADCSQYDVIVAMDRDTQFGIQTITQQIPKNVKLLSEFLPCDARIDVPDPQHRSVAVCNLALDMLESACQTISRKMASAPRVESHNHEDRSPIESSQLVTIDQTTS